MRQTLDFATINSAALSALPVLCTRWIPDGKRIGREYVAKNPTRADRRPGSFRLTCKPADGPTLPPETGAATRCRSPPTCSDSANPRQRGG